MKFRLVFGTIVFIIAFSLCIALLNFRFYLYNIEFYNDTFNELRVYELIPREVALDQTKNLFAFFKGNTRLDNSFFNEKELRHLDDVKKLIQLAVFLLYISVIAVFILFFILRKRLKYLFLGTGMLLLAMVLILYLVRFEWLFILFHKISFTNDLWILNPETDRLIQLFPIGFFSTFVETVLRNLVISGFFLIGFGSLLKYFQRN